MSSSVTSEKDYLLCRDNGLQSLLRGHPWLSQFHCFFSPLQFRALAPMYYRGSAAAIIVYDITKEVRLYLFILRYHHLLLRPLATLLSCCRRRFQRWRTGWESSASMAPLALWLPLLGTNAILPTSGELLDKRFPYWLYVLFLMNHIHGKSLAFILSLTLKNVLCYVVGPEVSS